MKHAARIPVLATELAAGPGAQELYVSVPQWISPSSLLRGQCAVISKVSSPPSRLCTVLNVQTSLPEACFGLLANAVLHIHACSFSWRISLGKWKGRSPCSGTTEKGHLSLCSLLTDYWEDVFCLYMVFRDHIFSFFFFSFGFSCLNPSCWYSSMNIPLLRETASLTQSQVSQRCCSWCK